MYVQPTRIRPWVFFSLAVQHYHLKQTLQFWNKVTSIYLTQNFLSNQASRYLRAIYTYILHIFRFPIGLWCLLLSTTPTPAPNPRNIPSLYDDVIIFQLLYLFIMFSQNCMFYTFLFHFCTCNVFVFKRISTAQHAKLIFNFS